MMLSPEHKNMIRQTLGTNNPLTRTTHLGCEDNPTVCRALTLDFANHLVWFTVIVKELCVARVSFSFQELGEIQQIIITALQSTEEAS